ncbi:hypothetical protein BRADI_1g00482v3 [Brachypodium distachyon]|uniref:Uncharacterized protein n=1 Tax=Brachypodium distachyon TaxID=15368 RepID=A0A2K2DHH5_BRADI|nr:hypothetical protein BRADI_1g00482v3 [Brachypodium distachyon]
MDEIETLPTSTFFRRHPLLLCFLFFLALLYTFFYSLFALVLASSPVLLLTAFLLGVVLVYSEPNVPEDHAHVYKKIRGPNTTTTTTSRHHSLHGGGGGGSDSSDSSSGEENNNPLAMSSVLDAGGGDDDDNDDSESESEDEPPEEKKHKAEVVRAVAWTMEDEKSIEDIGSLELERNAAVEKLMYRRLAGRQRRHTDLMVHTTDRKNPFDLDVPYHEEDFPGSAPSMLYPSHNPFFDDDDDDDAAAATNNGVRKNPLMLTRHESFAVGSHLPSDSRQSRFRPYFMIEKMQGQPVSVPEASRKSSSSSSSSSSSASAHAYASKEEATAATAEEEALEEAEATLEVKKSDEPRPHEGGMVAAVDVELISDSSDDDMLLTGSDGHKEQQMKVQQQQVMAVSDDDGESFEVESITKQVAIAAASSGKGKQLDTDTAYDYSLTAGKVEKKHKEPLDQPVAPPSKLTSIRRVGNQLDLDPAYDYSPSAGTAEKKQEEPLDQPVAMAMVMPPPNKLASMRRVFTEDAAHEAWMAPSNLEETTGKDVSEIKEPDILPTPALPPLPEAPPLAAASSKEKGVGKSIKYKPPSKKAVLGFFRK